MAETFPLNTLLTIILDELFIAENRRLERTIEVLNEKHNKLRLTQDDGFIFSGLYYRPKGNPGKPALQKASLDERLVDEGMAFLKDKSYVAQEKQLIKQALLFVLTPCQSRQDIRDALHDCLSDVLTRDIAALPRTRPHAFTIEGNPRAMRQYQAALPRMEFYSAARLFY